MEEKKTKQTPAKKNYDKKYRRERMYSIAFRLSRTNDKDLIELYEAIPNKMEWFRESLKATAKK
jgi:hypothetical protein